ncbi:MAG: ATP-binding cassette domain-containing protein [Lachnospiraceae bacterium]|nr:ATP-binding cassette domain-containing protein [Lachnospiraceae bacterium]MDD3797087.1 ATP-binding cassette domain-containing protein [Lachnospiraceae bacterium]
MMLEAREISFQYEKNSRMILENFSIQVESTDRIGLVAPSGFGKTTLCKILAGYERPLGGEVLVDGKALSEYRGYCPVQMIWQHPEQSVNPRRRMRAVIEEGNQVDPSVVDGLGIEADWMNRFPAEISGGEMQRFCIARVLGEGTRFLLADEISTMLDLITQSQIWHFLIEETQRRKIGLLTVSHSEELLKKVCTKLYYLETKTWG